MIRKSILKIVILLLVTEFPSIKLLAQETGTEKSDSLIKYAGKSISDDLLIGYNTRKSERISGSVSAIKNDKLLSFPSDNIIKQMQGLVPGLTVISSGQPGVLPKYYIRGFGSFSGGIPLIIVE